MCYSFKSNGSCSRENGQFAHINDLASAKTAEAKAKAKAKTKSEAKAKPKGKAKAQPADYAELGILSHLLSERERPTTTMKTDCSSLDSVADSD